MPKKDTYTYMWNIENDLTTIRQELGKDEPLELTKKVKPEPVKEPADVNDEATSEDVIISVDPTNWEDSSSSNSRPSQQETVGRFGALISPDRQRLIINLISQEQEP